MGTIAEKLEYLNGTKDAIKAAIEGKGVTVPDGTTFRGYADLIGGISGGSGTYQEKTATPTGEQFDVLPDDGYDAMSKVTVAGDSALKPWNIPEGTTIYGVVGTAKLAVTTDPPADLPVSKDDADAALAENDATADASAYDLMVLAQDDGNITYCYLAKDTQDSPFTITSYDPITTEFKANGWRRLSYHTTGEQAGTWTYDDFTDTESGGWNYLKNIRSCTREKLYYNGVEVWPDCKLSPMLAAHDDWYKGLTMRDDITEIYLMDRYAPADKSAVTETWDASDESVKGTVTVYIEGTKLTISGNGSGKICANKYSDHVFFGFCNVTDIHGLDILETGSVTGMSYMFDNCSSLTSLDLSGFDTSMVVSFRNMFENCSSLTSLDFGGFNHSELTVQGTLEMFKNCSSLTSLDLSGFSTKGVKQMSFMFYGCSSLTSLDVSSFDTSAVTYMSNMFGNCSSLTSLDLSSFDTSKATTMLQMFNGMNRLEEITLGSKFSFAGNGITDSKEIAVLPTPSAEYITGADGMWRNTSGVSFYPSDVPSNVADTYTAY